MFHNTLGLLLLFLIKVSVVSTFAFLIAELYRFLKLANNSLDSKVPRNLQLSLSNLSVSRIFPSYLLNHPMYKFLEL
jgi:hypothetical protein